MLADAGQRLVRIGERQEVVEENGVVARPGEMFGKTLGLVAVAQRSKAREMFLSSGCIEPIDRPTPWIDSA